jgi:hypothetical protein
MNNKKTLREFIELKKNDFNEIFVEKSLGSFSEEILRQALLNLLILRNARGFSQDDSLLFQ